ncbi:hypothetical protein [Aeromonas caviae]|uniref:hypothetical protein n=1 Tax=Aeromonas caviae TaxID=648 RepID=UPI00227E5508|nr:hypothetical protein [Aeromonas caviae]MCY9815479.1 hypothetical protein [Aeromonas caviae]
MAEDLIARVTRLEERQDEFEQRQKELTKFIAIELDAMGDYRNRTDSDLSKMDGKIELLTQIANEHQGIFETQEERNRAKAVNRRIKNHQTRLNNEKNKRKSK